MKTAEKVAASNQRKLNKKEAFENYKRKNYLEQYSFFINHGYQNEYLYITITTKNAEYLSSYYHEIKAPHTLVKYVKLVKEGKMKFRLTNDRGQQETLTFNEVKTNTLIERLSGLL